MKAALSIAFNDLRGKAGTVVVSKGKSSLVVRPRKSGKDPRSAGQEAIRFYLAKAAQAYKALTPTQIQAWKTYALTITKIDPVSGQTYHPSANSLFCGLAAKFLQISPTGTIPVAPPTSEFIGDSITLTATSPSAGTVTFTSTGANSSGVKTELLLQPLASPNRAPNPKAYRTKSFATFTAMGNTASVTVPAGYYAAAYRFVKTATGQATELIQLSILTVALSLEKGSHNASTSTSAASASKRKAA